MRVPVIRGHIGDWRYYSGVLNFKQIARLVTPSVDDFCNPSCLSDLLQRQLTENYLSIKEYLLTESQRFFNAIVLAIYDGDPKWLEIEFGDEFEDYSNVGFLDINEENVQIFPVDGQHRVKGIITALQENAELEEEEVPVIIIAHKNDIEGKRRTRKLFSTLNRRAKPVGDNYQIALDEDDVVAIVTRELIEDFVLFQGDRLVNKKNKQIPAGNMNAFTSLLALYQCNEWLIQKKLGLSDRDLKKYKLYRPAEDVIKECYGYINAYWGIFIDCINVVNDYIKEDSAPAQKFRNKDGGNLLFRPIGLIEFVKVSEIIASRKNLSFDQVLKKMNGINLSISEKPWRDVIWDGKRIINRVSLSLIRLLLLYMTDETAVTQNEVQKMKETYISATNYSGDDDIHSILQ